MSKVKNPTFAFEPPQMTILSDHPSLSSIDDFLRMESRLAVVLDILRHKNTNCPITIAIYGDWGTGKTSAMHWLESQLDLWNSAENKKRGDHPRVYPVWFDPWKYHSREEVWRGIIAEVILALFTVRNLDEQNFIPRMKEAAKQFGAFLGKGFLHALAHLKVKTGAVEVSGEMFRDIYEEYDKTNHPEKAHLNQFEETLKRWVEGFVKENERIAVFIDDLDRCMPDVTLEVLEAIKLYLNIPQIMFVVGVDRDVVDSVVIKHYDTHGLGKEKARQYLDKIFQVEIQIPPSEQQMKEFLDKQVNALDKSTGGYWKTKLAEEHRQALETGIRELARHNPRETKRLLNSALLRGRAAADNPDLCQKHDESLLFAQGVQLFLIQRIIQNWISNGRNLLREDEALEWFEQWSRAACQFLEFKPPAREVGNDAAKVSQKGNELQSDSEKAYEALKNVRLAGDDRKAVDKLLLLEDNLLWELLRIPFSVEVAQSTPKLTETKTMLGALEQPFSQKLTEQPDLVNVLPSVIRDRIAKASKKRPDQVSFNDLEDVVEFDLSDLEISVADLKHILELPNLNRIRFSGEQLTQDSIQFLEKLSIEQEYDFRGIKMTEEDWGRLAKIPRLYHLNLGGTQIKDEALIQVGRMASLSDLYLGRNKISDNGLKYLEKLENLKTLSLASTLITDAAIEQIAEHHRNLKYLFLDNTKITVTSLELHLPKLKSLSTLWLRDMKMSEETIRKLKKEMPNLQIQITSG